MNNKDLNPSPPINRAMNNRIKAFLKKICMRRLYNAWQRSSSNVIKPTRKLIHLARQNKWQKFIDRCESHPQDATYQEMTPGNYVLHQVLRMGGGFVHVPNTGRAPVEAIRALIRAFPRALFDVDERGRSVLFVSNYNEWNAEVLELVIRSSMPASVKDLESCPGLDMLPRDIIQDHIVSYLPNMPLRSDCIGHNMLHSMIIHHADISRIQLLMKCCPKLAFSKTFTGRTPLHMACYCESKLQILKDLVKIHPEAVQMKDDCKRTPTQALLFNDRIPSAVKLHFISLLFEYGLRRSQFELIQNGIVDKKKLNPYLNGGYSRLLQIA